jgi:hypothetical protein
MKVKVFLCLRTCTALDGCLWSASLFTRSHRIAGHFKLDSVSVRAALKMLMRISALFSCHCQYSVTRKSYKCGLQRAHDTIVCVCVCVYIGGCACTCIFPLPYFKALQWNFTQVHGHSEHKTLQSETGTAHYYLDGICANA